MTRRQNDQQILTDKKTCERPICRCRHDPPKYQIQIFNNACKIKLKFASTSEFGDYSSREVPPASIFHDIFEISNFAPDLGSRKSVARNCSGAQRPNYTHQHISLDKLTGGYQKRLSGF